MDKPSGVLETYSSFVISIAHFTLWNSFQKKELYLVQNVYWPSILHYLLKRNRYPKGNANQDLFYSNSTKRNAGGIKEGKVHAR